MRVIPEGHESYVHWAYTLTVHPALNLTSGEVVVQHMHHSGSAPGQSFTEVRTALRKPRLR
eukprot:427054-Pyramimonas_sp.AAC.2